MNWQSTRRLSPKKLLLSKWTAAVPSDKEKHFIVTQLLEAAPPASGVELIEIEAVYSGRSFKLPWRDLLDDQRCLQGWQ